MSWTAHMRGKFPYDSEGRYLIRTGTCRSTNTRSRRTARSCDLRLDHADGTRAAGAYPFRRRVGRRYDPR